MKTQTWVKKVDANFSYCTLCFKQLEYSSGGFQALIQRSEKLKHAIASDVKFSSSQVHFKPSNPPTQLSDCQPKSSVIILDPSQTENLYLTNLSNCWTVNQIVYHGIGCSTFHQMDPTLTNQFEGSQTMHWWRRSTMGYFHSILVSYTHCSQCISQRNISTWSGCGAIDSWSSCLVKKSFLEEDFRNLPEHAMISDESLFLRHFSTWFLSLAPELEILGRSDQAK